MCFRARTPPAPETRHENRPGKRLPASTLLCALATSQKPLQIHPVPNCHPTQQKRPATNSMTGAGKRDFPAASASERDRILRDSGISKLVSLVAVKLASAKGRFARSHPFVQAVLNR